MKDYIIIPTYNERENISRLIPRIFQLYPDIHVIIVDDNSEDGTQDAVKDLARTFSNTKLHSRPYKMGLASAYTQTMQKILNSESDVGTVITMDADLSHDPAVIKTMLEKLKNNDLIIGSRYVKGGSIQKWNIIRKILSQGGNIYARKVLEIPIQDLTTGFQCFRAELLRKYDFTLIHSTGYAFLMEMKVIAHRLGAKIKEVPIIFTERAYGKSKLSNRIIYEGIIEPWRIRLSRY